MTMSTLLWILGIGVFFYLMRRSGGGCCGGHNQGDANDHGNHNSNHENDAGHDHHTPKMAISANGPEKDPVCSMDIDNHSIERDYTGRTFYFCSDRCRKIFDLNPNKYVQI